MLGYKKTVASILVMLPLALSLAAREELMVSANSHVSVNNLLSYINHLCHMLFIRSDSLEPAHTQRKGLHKGVYMSWGTTGGYPIGHHKYQFSFKTIF